MLKLKKKEITDVGFMDPYNIFKDKIIPYTSDLKWRRIYMLRFLDNQYDKTMILIPYIFE